MLASIDIMVMDPDDGWKAFMELTCDAGTETLGFVGYKQRDWFDENDADISELIDSLHKAHHKYIQDNCCDQTKKRYQKKKQQVQQKL